MKIKTSLKAGPGSLKPGTPYKSIFQPGDPVQLTGGFKPGTPQA